MIKILFVVLLGFLTFSSCKSKNTPCQYFFAELFRSDTPNVVVSYQNDTLYDVKDVVDDTASPGGTYIFDKKRNLRFYAFFVEKERYRYSETYDSLGNLIESEGTPVLEYKIWKRDGDTVLFNCLLFSLFKKYDNIEVFTNMGDTVRPELLYKSEEYTNVKCFQFKLKVAKSIHSLTLYNKISFTNTCTSKTELIIDTVSFAGVSLKEQ